MKSQIEFDLLNYINRHIEPSFLKSTKLDFKNNKSGNKSIMIISTPTVWRFGDNKEKLFARFKLSDKDNYIEFPSATKSIFNEYNLTYNKQSDGYLRISISDFLDYPDTVAKSIINKAFIRCFNYPAFGCCSKFSECEEKGICVHEDMIYATVACQYKKFVEGNKNTNESF